MESTFAISYLRQSSENSWAEVTWFDNAIRVGIVAAIAWFGLRFVASAETVLLRLQRQQNSIEPIGGKLARDETSLAAISKLLRACIFITATLLVLQQLGVSISGLLAFGGVGGLVLGFAAQQLLANFFGGLMLYLERPFKVGDWVRSHRERHRRHYRRHWLAANSHSHLRPASHLRPQFHIQQHHS